MYIHEAIQNRTREQPCITRKAWGDLFPGTAEHPWGVVIWPTDSPECCLIISAHRKESTRGWQPTAGDLAADDWVPVRCW